MGERVKWVCVRVCGCRPISLKTEDFFFCAFHKNEGKERRKPTKKGREGGRREGKRAVGTWLKER